MKKYSKSIALSLIIILTIYILTPALFSSIFVYKARASSIDRKDVYRGVGIALLLVLIAKLGKAAESNTEPVDNPSDINLSGEDIELLARVIYAEARGEPYEGQVAVGAVVLNRVESPDFPDTVKEVIFQDGQFSSVDDGQIYLIPNKIAFRAAREALNGRDPSQGALYFYNPKTAKTLWWLSQRKVTVKIGNHVFAK
ncbi:cell wall hydrolase [Halothermothrix orenii]|uniref:Cell wall hydrolase SleB n=1 Tax=Halothermothrix orenii (strain H 168 / OCM 544 / DSM 9562) TaxID=373903 RepID=B8CXA7_HALOH|nr:cell wall hydrolase [Halothermothrix orenii]ACL69926.1 cell wall hydrolase SleB [Halothermothrix orenii H 168]